MPFRADFIDQADQERENQKVLLEKLWRERTEFSTLLAQAVPAFPRFEVLLERMLDIKGAVATGALQPLRTEGLLTTSSVNLTPQRLVEGGKVWGLRWVARGGLDVDRSGPVPRTATAWHSVELHVRIKPDERRIDTEFFLLNTEHSERPNDVNDREKLHIVWAAPEDKDRPLELSYLGFGTNQPFGLAPAEGKGAAIDGRSRFYVFDADRGISLEHRVERRGRQKFDWDWSHRPMQKLTDDERSLQFVDGQGEWFCLADRETAQAAQGLTREELAKLVLREEFGPDKELPASAWDALPPKAQAALDSVFSRVDVRVSRVVGRAGAPPTLAEIAERARADYPAYFFAFEAACAGHRDLGALLKARQALEPSRLAEYEQLFSTACVDAFDAGDLPFLPATLGELLSHPTAGLPPELLTTVTEWKEGIAAGIDADLYHYGQSPYDRIAHLLLGIHLTTAAEFGNLYERLLQAARGCLDTGNTYGAFDVSWP